MLSSQRRRRLKPKRKTKPPNAEDLEVIVGQWKVECVSFKPLVYSGTSEPAITLPDYSGVELRLDDGCDVTWILPAELESNPLFHTTNFNIEKQTLELFGGHDGKKFSFDVEVKDCNHLVLETEVEELEADEDSLDGFMVLTLVKAARQTEEHLEGFTLQGALDEGYFSDLTVTSAEGTQFRVHHTVLNLSVLGMTSSDWELLVGTLKTSLARVALCYAYSHRLPTTLSLPVVMELSAALNKQPHLSHLAELCKTFIGSHNLKQRLLGLVDDLQASLELAKRMLDSTDVANPVKVTYTIKQLAKEVAVGAVKFCVLCELYSHNKKEMSKPEKQEVLEYVRARVVVFIDLLCELIDSALAKYNSLTETQRIETATYIIPEVEKVWDLINVTCGDVKTAMASRLNSLTKKKDSRRPDLKVSLLLQLITRGKEVKRLHTISKEFDDFLQTSNSKREDFKEMSEADRVTKILRAIEGLEKEGVTQRTQLQAAKAQILMDNALDWKKFKVLTSLCCTYVSWGVQRARQLREPMLPSILQACKFVQRSELNEALLYLDLLTKSDLHALREDEDDERAGPLTLPKLTAAKTSNSNQLADGCFKLLDSDKFTDMEFVLPSDNGGSDVVIKAHRVIVASRCEWIKRALLSGMREAIDRRVVVRDYSEATFRLFLYYLYGGPLKLEATPIEEVVELLTAADQYETNVLRGRCELCLVNRVEDNTVFPLLMVADRYSVRKLRETTLQHILKDSDVIMREVDGYSELPNELKQELRGLLSSPVDPLLVLQHSEPHRNRKKDSSSSDSSNSVIPVTVSGDFTLDSLYHDPQTLAFQEKLSEVRAVVGEEASDELLRELLLQADLDVNRAINYYFNTI